MEKLTTVISPEEWGSLITKYRPDSKKLTLADFTEGTVNADTDVAGTLTKRKGGPNYNPTLLPAAPKDQFEAIFSDGARHLLVVANGEIRYSSGDTIFNSVVNGTGYSAQANFEFATTQDRVYGGNAVNAPIVYDRNTSYGGVAYTAPRIKVMGVQAPGTAPTAAVAAGGAVPVGAHTYKVTFLYYDAEESNGSPTSNTATTTPGNQTVNLTSVPIGGYGVTARKIYRDNNDGLYLHVGTIPDNTTTIFADTLAVGATPTEIPEFNNAPPTFGLIVTWLDKQWLAKVPGDPSTLFYTETGMPDIVRPENQLLCNQEDPITAFIVYFGRLIVFNRRSMGQILGSTPDTFRYSAIPSSIGCVDNRTLQIRVIEGVPVLIWLSDRGFYSYDGNAINYISDEIEDLVNFNIQQAVQQKNSNTQTSLTHFQAGTASQGIDLLAAPGSITTKGYVEGTATPGTNPRRTFDDQADWESGSPIANLALRAGDNLLKAITTITPSLTSGGGSLTGGMIFGSTPRLSTFANFTGQNNVTSSGVAQFGGSSSTSYSQLAQRINTTSRAGTITQVRVRIGAGIPTDPSLHRYRIKVWADSGGQPGTVLFNGPQRQFATVGTSEIIESGLSVPVGASSFVWIGMERIDLVRRVNPVVTSDTTFPGPFKVFNGASWNDVSAADLAAASLSASANRMRVGFTFSQTPVSNNGTWTSTVYNNNSVTANASTINVAYSSLSSFGTKSQSFIVEASNDGIGFTQIFTSSSLTSFSSPISLAGQRYFRFKLTMSTTDDRETNALTAVSLAFPDGVEWISPAIDCTSDVTDFTSLSVSSSVPSGSIVVTVATSADNISYTSFVAFGSEVVQRYIKIRVVITKGGSGSTTPSISSLILRWTVVANFVSSIIDTAANPPAGWDIFLASFTTNGGTVQFQMRSATTSGGIPAATFFTVTPTEFPNAVTPNQFVQWKVIITSNDNDVPVVDSVTVQWFISNVASLRPASIFVDSRYYVALAELNTTFNTVLLELDLNGKWRRHRGLDIATFSYFFNRPYFGLATSGQIRKFLEGLTDAGAAIEFDVRFKATDYSTKYQDHSSKIKLVGEAILQGINTGATYQLFYSVDLGETFYPMYTPTGASSFVSGTDGQNFYVRFRPLWDGSVPFAGRTIMYRVYSNDLNQVEIKSLEATAFLRLQSPVITG